MAATMKKNWKNLQKDQGGLMSFLVVMIVMIVLSVIVMSYARVVRREQLQTLDRQLNVQALYAAESAVNDAMHALANDTTDVLKNGDYTDCDDFTTAASLDSNIGTGTGVAYSCLLVDTTPQRIELAGVNKNESTVVPLRAKDGGQINRVKISWDSDVAGGGNIAGCPTSETHVFSPNWPNCELGIVRFELLENISNRASMISDHAVGFLIPFRSGGGFSSGISVYKQAPNQTLNKGETTGVNCTSGDDPRRCTMTLTNLSITNGYLRLRSIYRNTPITIEAYRTSVSQPLELRDAQVEIDVTGRASGVIKRIKVHRQIPSANEDKIAPEFALQSRNTLCKRFIYYPGAAPSTAITSPQSPVNNNDCDPDQP